MTSSDHFILSNPKMSTTTLSHQIHNIPISKIDNPTTILITNTHTNFNSERSIANKDTGKKCFCRLRNVDEQVDEIRKYYENALEEYEEKVAILEHELNNRNNQILKLKQNKLSAKEELSTHPKSKISAQEKEPFELCYEDLLIPPKHTKSKSEIKINIKTVDDINMNGLEWIKEWEGLSKKLKIGNKNAGNEIKRTLESSNDCGESEFCETSVIECSGVSEVSGIEPDIQTFVEEGKGSKIKYDENMEVKTYFDSIPLMTRLSRSAILAKKINKILEPKEIEDGPEAGLLNKKLSVCSEKREEKEEEIELEIFVEELMKKHKEIVEMIEKLEIEKEEEIRNIREYYENAIKEIEQQNLFNTGNGNKSCGNFHKREEKYWREGNKENKEGIFEGRKGEGEMIRKGIGRRSLD